jgi:tRNA uridine 5-carbamoylmethylation protein Kti12
MTELIVTRGLPASGKTTFAKTWVAVNPRKRARVEKDQLRAMMHDSVWLGKHTEDQVNMVQYNMVYDLLKSGISVVVSDTNLDEFTFSKWKDLGRDRGLAHVEFKMQDLREVPLQVCLDRNAQRTGKEFIPVDVIIGMHDRYIKGVS